MKCSGTDIVRGLTIEVSFGESIETTATSSESADLFLAPGFIDLQVNGFAGVDYNNPTVSREKLDRSLHVLRSTGVTRFYPTVITGPPRDMVGALRNLAGFGDGFHVEGPHISPEDGPRGAHPRASVRPPDFDEFRRWQDATDHQVRLVTLAPEWPDAPRYIERVAAEGVVVAIGHTQATTAEIADAVSAGATLSTHLGNGAHSVLRRHPNYIWDQLAEDRLMADFIVDGIHLDAAFLKVALRAKGIDRSVLVTDASTPAGAAPGRYRLGEQEIDLTADGRVVLAGTDRLAGSALRMDRGIENLVRLCGLSLPHAIQMATINAARAGGVPGRSGGLAPGDRADFVRFAWDGAKLDVMETWVSGELVYSARNADIGSTRDARLAGT
jgi:N-acetylglucosamine-6-phosphate deacetylase